jgi:hypothetical protein
MASPGLWAGARCRRKREKGGKQDWTPCHGAFDPSARYLPA